MSNTAPVIYGLPWYEPECFERICALMPDKDRLFGTYADWFTQAQKTEDNLRRQGATTVRVLLDLVQFPTWCATHRPGLDLDAKARNAYASLMAAEQYRARQAKASH
jgi:hypothetical protein